jgi:hypothetical protein
MKYEKKKKTKQNNLIVTWLILFNLVRSPSLTHHTTTHTANARTLTHPLRTTAAGA